MTDPSKYRFLPDGSNTAVRFTPALGGTPPLAFRYGPVSTLLHDVTCLQVLAKAEHVGVQFLEMAPDYDGGLAYVQGEVDIHVNGVKRLVASWGPGEEKTVTQASCTLRIRKTGGTHLQLTLDEDFGNKPKVRFHLNKLEWHGRAPDTHVYRHPDPNVVFTIVDNPSTSDDWPGCPGS